MEVVFHITRQEAESEYHSTFTEPLSAPSSGPSDAPIAEPTVGPTAKPGDTVGTGPTSAPVLATTDPLGTASTSVPLLATTDPLGTGSTSVPLLATRVPIVTARDKSVPASGPIIVIDNKKDGSNHSELTGSQLWIEIEGVRLTVSDKEVVSDVNGLLNDKVIQAACALLKLQFPGYTGLEDPILSFAGHITVDGNGEIKFVQVFNDPTVCHWITVSNINCGVGQLDVYCSLLSVPSLRCVEAISAFAPMKTPALEIRVVNVARQRDYKSCGFYAIANAQALLMGKDPRNLVYSQTVMRKHLLQCLEKKAMTPVPVEHFRSVRKSFVKIQKFSVFCVCRKICGNVKVDMVQCSLCREWFHPACIGMGDNSFHLLCQQKRLTYKCQSCSD